MACKLLCPGPSYPLPMVYRTSANALIFPSLKQAKPVPTSGAFACAVPSVWRSRLTNLQPCGFFFSLGFHFPGCFLSSAYLSFLSLTPTPLYHSTPFYNIYHSLESSEMFLLPPFHEDESSTKAETASCRSHGGPDSVEHVVGAQ